MLSLLALLASASTHAYRVEMGVFSSSEELDWDDFDQTDKTGSAGTYVTTYFSDVNDDLGAYQEAAFLSKASSIDLTLAKSETEIDDIVAFIATMQPVSTAGIPSSEPEPPLNEFLTGWGGVFLLIVLFLLLVGVAIWVQTRRR